MLSSALLFSFSIPLLRKVVSETVCPQEFLYLAYLMPPLILTDGFISADNFREVISPDAWSIE